MGRAKGMSMIEKWLACTIVVLFVSVGQLVEGFQVHPCNRVQITTALAAQPRRNLKKRRGRRMRDQQLKIDNDFPWETAESRPLVSSISKEAGEDYWIDEKEAEAARLREEAIKNRKANEGEIPKEKLWTEVKAPYKQNWIGIISVVIVVLTTVVTKFPELLNTPVIEIPDL